jgi:hypothetical protein
MARLFRIALYWCSLAITFICGIAAITITAAVESGKLADPEAWITAVLFAVVGVIFWLLCRSARVLTED